VILGSDFKCPFCPCIFSSKDDLDRHLLEFGNSSHRDAWRSRHVKVERDGYDAGADNSAEGKGYFLISKPNSGLSGKKKRAFHRLMSGFTRAHAHGDRLRFMTLTTAVGGSVRLLRRHFQTLRKRIKRHFHFEVKYWSILTNEGNGVLHIVFKGGFIPHAWLSAAWNSIHGAFIVDIRALKGSPKRLTNYLVSNYLCKQSYERLSWSWSWVFRGFVGLWKSRFSSWYRSDHSACLKAWNLVVSTYSVAKTVRFGSLLGG
jgi:hypothetical protein